MQSHFMSQWHPLGPLSGSHQHRYSIHDYGSFMLWCEWWPEFSVFRSLGPLICGLQKSVSYRKQLHYWKQICHRTHNWWYRKWRFEGLTIKELVFTPTLTAWSIHQLFSTIWCAVSGISKLYQIHSDANLFAKPDFTADNLLIKALLSVGSHSLFPISIHSFSLYSRLCSQPSHDLLLPFPPKLRINQQEASYMLCSIHSLWFRNAAQLITEAARGDDNS